MRQQNNFHNKASSMIFGLIGDPVAHSLSPLMWNAAFVARNFQAIYLAFSVNSAKLHRAFAGLQALGVCGINVTRPHKHTVAQLCNQLNYPADILLTVNTVKFAQEKSIGYNTDAIALKKILKKISQNSKATVLGNGNTATATIWALKESGCKQIFQVSRSKAKKPAYLDTDIDWNWLEWRSDNLKEAVGAAEILINTTPLGWHKEDRISEFETKLNKHQTFIDVNYSDCSNLMACAQKAGCKVIDGRELLVLQATESFKLLTELEAPENIMRSCIF